MGTHAGGSQKLRELSLFSGAGGGLLASQWIKSWRTVCYVEWDKYCQQVIQARIRDGLLHDAPIWDNVNTFDGRPWRGLVDVISAGFPCQPFSAAGKRQSNDDSRNGWPATIRIIREVRPRYVFLENVRGLLSAVDKSADEPVPYFGTILRDLAAAGYDAQWRLLSAAECGAPHQRKRIWIVAHATGKRLERANRPKLESSNTARSSWWEVEPELGRLADGVADRVERTKALGNGQVPIVAAAAWDLLTQGRSNR